MKKQGKHLKFYMDCMERGRMPSAGLCNCASRGDIHKDTLMLFVPTIDQLGRIKSPLFWASDSSLAKFFEFTTLRQTIVLFMAAMNDEL